MNEIERIATQIETVAEDIDNVDNLTLQCLLYAWSNKLLTIAKG